MDAAQRRLQRRPRYGLQVELRPVDAGNWAACAAVAPAPGEFVAAISFYLCLCHYEPDWQPLAIQARDAVVGFVMWAVDPVDDSHWIGGLVIGAAHRRRGYGRLTVTELLERFRAAGATAAALSYDPANEPARRLYASLGFEETGETVDGETVARLVLGPA